MDEEMSFPNPVVRTDLPVKKRIWPKVVLGLVVVVILCVVFLPQILNNKIGRRLLRAKLEGRFNTEVAIGDFKTSWFGGTRVSQFWIKSSEGRVIGCNAMKCDMSLIKMLRGNYKLGNCEIDGLIVDYVLDIGNDSHTDTYELLTGLAPRNINTPPTVLSKLSGDIKLTNCQLSLSRQYTDPIKLTPVELSVRFVSLDGEIKITSLDQPWTYTLEGTTGATGEERGTSCKSSGTICLGKNGLLTPADVSVDATFDGTDIPTSIISVFLPMISGDDAKSAFGNNLDRAKASLKGTGGVLRLSIDEAASASAQIHLQPLIDLNTQPATLKISSKSVEENQVTAAFPVSRGPMRRGLTSINPLAASGIAGTVVLKIESLEMPISRYWEKGSAKAELEFHDLLMPAKYEISPNESPKDFVTQLALIAGPNDASDKIPLATHKFVMDLGEITLAPSTFNLADQVIGISGTSYTSYTEGKMLGIKLKLASPALAGNAMVTIPVIGKPDRPMLNLDAAKSDLPVDISKILREARDKNLAMLRGKLSQN